MKKMELSQMENLEGGRKFWGWEQGAGYCNEITGTWVYTSTYYVLGIAVSTKEEASIGTCTNNALFE